MAMLPRSGARPQPAGEARFAYFAWRCGREGEACAERGGRARPPPRGPWLIRI